jgi:hypothetical protein
METIRDAENALIDRSFAGCMNPTFPILSFWKKHLSPGLSVVAGIF